MVSDLDRFTSQPGRAKSRDGDTSHTTVAPKRLQNLLLSCLVAYILIVVWRCPNNTFVSIRIGLSESKMAVYAAGIEICSILITRWE